MFNDYETIWYCVKHTKATTVSYLGKLKLWRLAFVREVML